jgi:hypothetical protein
MLPTAGFTSLPPAEYHASAKSSNSSQVGNTAAQFANQWRSPSDILSVLLLLGPDIIMRALAQLCGETITPVVFSYGWVAYAVNAMLSVFGGLPSPLPSASYETKVPADGIHLDGQMLPKPDFPAIVIGAKSGHIRNNQSWIIGRLLRDSKNSRRKEPLQLNKLASNYEALRISVFQVDRKRKPGVPVRDWAWYSGFVVLVAQIAISIAPLVISTDWAPLLVTVGGTVLAFSQGAMSQWREEKWACPTSGGWTVSITQGNGSRNVIVILGNDIGLDLEILAGGSKRIEATPLTRIVTLVLAFLWLVFLISVAGLQANSWCE